MDLEVILGIVSAALVGVAAIFGGKLAFVAKIRDKLNLKFAQVEVLIKEVLDVIRKIQTVVNKIDTILEDKKITPEEIQEFKAVLQEFKAELIDVKVAFLKLIGKG